MSCEGAHGLLLAAGVFFECLSMLLRSLLCPAAVCCAAAILHARCCPVAIKWQLTHWPVVLCGAAGISFFGGNPIGTPQVAYAVASAYPQYREWLDINHKLKAPATGQKLQFFITHYAFVRMKVCANTMLAGGFVNLVVQCAHPQLTDCPVLCADACVPKLKLRLRRATPDLPQRKDMGAAHNLAAAAETMLLREELKAFHVPDDCPWAIIDDGCEAFIDDEVRAYFEAQFGEYVSTFKVEETLEQDM